MNHPTPEALTRAAADTQRQTKRPRLTISDDGLVSFDGPSEAGIDLLFKALKSLVYAQDAKP